MTTKNSAIDIREASLDGDDTRIPESFSAFEQDLSEVQSCFPSRLPRYTSYPTAAELSDKFNFDETARELRSSFDGHESVSLYVHIPFCPKLCYFCACNKIISQDADERTSYLEYLRRELAHFRPQNSRESPWNISQLHYGGGSPSYLDLAQLKTLDTILADAGVPRDIPRSIEIDCRTIDAEKIALLYQQGFRRFSLGIQDIDPTVQKLVNRLQPIELVEQVVDFIRQYKDVSINFDLIYGLPEQTSTSFHKTMEKVISLAPERIALYGYANVSQKVKVQRTLEKYHLPTTTERLSLFHSALRTLHHAGYGYIGLDHFAKKDDELSCALTDGTLRRNFMGYTVEKGEVLLGLGVSAISDTSGMLSQNFTEDSSYRRALGEERLPIARIVRRSEDDRIRAFCIESLMCRRQVLRTDLVTTFGDSPLVHNAFDAASAFISARVRPRLATADKSQIRVSERGAPFLRHFASIFDSYLAGKGSHAFSSSI